MCILWVVYAQRTAKPTDAVTEEDENMTGVIGTIITLLHLPFIWYYQPGRSIDYILFVLLVYGVLYLVVFPWILHSVNDKFQEFIDEWQEKKYGW